VVHKLYLLSCLQQILTQAANRIAAATTSAAAVDAQAVAVAPAPADARGGAGTSQARGGPALGDPQVGQPEGRPPGAAQLNQQPRAPRGPSGAEECGSSGGQALQDDTLSQVT
jgi:hypothetical protein